ncbi:YybH family protein [Mucilaginibacter pocheonensis]|uniref:Ketosteroid isomerase-like protein n=1 Tax=Mucilaginibacter pocheonensis TaxID=398050 RepID=A0ABU1T884_9SPHI|nr:nuclear transport factor 2 family protein [Mucilaginibacter pocheonensis]MDR6941620.1 ketosteroid isomerase-like protein [Mucilaginibacter pocheonensis]
MKRNKFLSVAPLVVMFMMYYNQGYVKPPVKSKLTEAKKAIARSNSIYFQAFVKNDPSIFINRYADDCMIMPPDMQPLRGAAGAREFFKIAYTRFGLRDGKFITTAVYGDGDNFVTEEGLWQSFNAQHMLVDDGKFLVLWKKTPKGWKMFRDSFSSNRSKK